MSEHTTCLSNAYRSIFVDIVDYSPLTVLPGNICSYQYDSLRSEVFAWSTTSRLGWSNSWLRTKAHQALEAQDATQQTLSKRIKHVSDSKAMINGQMVKRCPKSHLSIYSPETPESLPGWSETETGGRSVPTVKPLMFQTGCTQYVASCAAGCLRKNKHLLNLPIAFLHSDSASAMYQTSQPIGDDSAIQCLESHRASWYLLSTSSKVQLLLDVTGWATWLASKFWMSECYAWPAMFEHLGARDPRTKLRGTLTMVFEDSFKLQRQRCKGTSVKWSSGQ